MKNHRLRQLRGSFQAISQAVEKALLAGGLQPASAIARGIDLAGCGKSRLRGEAKQDIGYCWPLHLVMRAIMALWRPMIMSYI
jgi:hypothetical protein